MKVTILSLYYFPETTAATHLYSDLADDFSGYGADVTVICGMPKRFAVSKQIDTIHMQVKGAKVIRIGRKTSARRGLAARGLQDFIDCLRIYKAAKRTESDIYYINSTPPFLGIAGAFLARKSPTIYGLQDIFPDSLLSIRKYSEKTPLVWFLRKLEHFVYRRNTIIQTISKDMYNALIRKGVPKEKLNIVENWIDLSSCFPVLRAENKLFKELDLPEDKFIISYAGNIGLLQNIETILLSAMSIEKEYPQIHFVIVGGGSWEKSMKQSIIDKAVQNVSVFPMQGVDRVAEIYSLGDVELVTLKPGVTRHSAPSKLMSIFAAGRPVICEVDLGSDICADITKKRLGSCVSPGDVDGMVKAIIALYNQKEQLDDIGARCRSYAEERYDRSVHTRQIFDLALATIKTEG